VNFLFQHFLNSRRSSTCNFAVNEFKLRARFASTRTLSQMVMCGQQHSAVLAATSNFFDQIWAMWEKKNWKHQTKPSRRRYYINRKILLATTIFGKGFFFIRGWVWLEYLLVGHNEDVLLGPRLWMCALAFRTTHKFVSLKSSLSI